MEIRLEYKFLKFLDSNTTPLTEEIDINEFMIANFKKPNPLSPKTINGNDKGVNFLKRLKKEGFIEYDELALSHVNTWFVDGGDDPKIKRWFDTLHEPFYVELTDLYYKGNKYKRLSLSRLLNKKLVLKAIKKVIAILIIIGKAIWKYLVTLSITLIGVYLSLGHNFADFIKWAKYHF